MAIKSGDIMRALRLTIRRKMNEIGLSEYDLSRKTEVDPRTIINFEDGSGGMSIESLTRILAVLEVEPWQFDIYTRFSTYREFIDFVKEQRIKGDNGTETARKLNMSLNDLRVLYSKALCAEKTKERSETNGDCRNHTSY